MAGPDAEEKWKAALSPEQLRNFKRTENLSTYTSTANNLLWLLMVVLKLHAAALMFVMVAHFKWRWPWQAWATSSVLWLLIISGLHYNFGSMIAYYMLAVYRIDQFIRIRLLKIAIYSVVYLFYAKPKNIQEIRVYFPVAHTLTGILTCKMYGYKTRDLIQEFTFLMTPAFFDLLGEGIYMTHGTTITERFVHPFLYLVVIITGIISLVTPRIVPPRIKETRVPAPAAAPLDLEIGINTGEPPIRPISEAIRPISEAIQQVAGEPTTTAVLTALLATDAEIFVRANEALTLANTLVASSITNDIAFVAATVASAAAEANELANAISKADPSNRRHASAATTTAATYTKAAGIANIALFATEPGQETLYDILMGWYWGLRNDKHKISKKDEWKTWANPGKIKYYDDFVKFE